MSAPSPSAAVRVLHVVPALGKRHGGPSFSVPLLAEGLAQVGCAVLLVTEEEDPSAANWPDPAHAPVRQIACSRRAIPHVSSLAGPEKQLADICAEFRPEVIHTHALWLPILHVAARVARQQRLPHVVSPRGMLSAWARQHGAWKKRLAWWLYQRRDLAAAGMLHATSQLEAADFRAAGLTQPIVVIPNGLAMPATVPPAPAADSTPRLALCMSRIHPKKGMRELVEAWAQRPPQGWHLRFVGPDDIGHAAELNALIQQMGVRDSVQIAPAVTGEEKWRLLRSAALFILPSHSENFGIVVAEALAAGVPVITTHGTPWAELERKGCGWWIPLARANLIATLTSATALSPEELRAMGARGQAWVAAEFAPLAAAARMRDAYRWLLDPTAPRPDTLRE